MLDCVDVAFLPGEILDVLPRPSRLGMTRISGIDLNKARMLAALAALVALAAAPEGFTVAELTEPVHSMAGQTDADYSIRRTTYDIRKLRAKELFVKPDRSRRYQVPPEAAPTITALSVPRYQVVSQPYPRRSSQSTTRPQTCCLDAHRPRLRVPPHRHAGPLQRSRHRHQCRPGGCMDNLLSITRRKLLVRPGNAQR
jgi:hypothetical protein